MEGTEYLVWINELAEENFIHDAHALHMLTDAIVGEYQYWQMQMPIFCIGWQIPIF